MDGVCCFAEAEEFAGSLAREDTVVKVAFDNTLPWAVAPRAVFCLPAVGFTSRTGEGDRGESLALSDPLKVVEVAMARSNDASSSMTRRCRR